MSGAKRAIEQARTRTEDLDAYLVAVDELLEERLGYDVGVWATLDPATSLLTGCTMSGQRVDVDRLEQLCRLEYTAGDDVGSLRVLLAEGGRTTSLRTEVDDPGRVRRYREITEPLGSYDELRAPLMADGICWGLLIAHRGRRRGAFSPAELEAAAGLAPGIAEGIRLALLRAAVREPASLAEPPGQLFIDPGGDVVAGTAVGERWLDRVGGAERLPFLLASVRPEADEGWHRPVTLASAEGPVAVHGAPAVDGGVALVFERPRPIEMTTLVIAAYGLTARERQVAELVLAGLTTKQVARRLDISDYTVQDHLKAIFAKTGVRTRGDLAWELHARFYLPPIREGATPGPYGYFLGDGSLTALGDEV